MNPSYRKILSATWPGLLLALYTSCLALNFQLPALARPDTSQSEQQITQLYQTGNYSQALLLVDQALP